MVNSRRESLFKMLDVRRESSGSKVFNAMSRRESVFSQIHREKKTISGNGLATS